MTEERGEPGEQTRSWLYDHIGRLSGFVLGLCAFAFISFLAIIGSKPALGLVVVLVVGVVFIALGGRMRGGR